MMLVPCGKCMACRIARTSEWTTRIMHELIGKPGCFVTLTYNDEHLPANGTLVKEHLQLFIKRLRKYLGGQKIKYFACGEYGDTTNRPHYHAVLIAWNPEVDQTYMPDKKHRASKEIEKLWKYGNNTIGYPDREAIQYVVGYIRKKLTGMRSVEYGDRLPPFQLQSQGIGKEYAERHKEQILSDKGITRDGKNVGIPRYYRKKLIDKDSVEEYHYHKRCEEARAKIKAEYEDLYDYTMARQSDEERRRKQLEAAEQLFKKGRL